MEIVRRGQQRGVGGSRLQGSHARRSGAGEDQGHLVWWYAAWGQHTFEENPGDVLWPAYRNGFTLEVGDGFKRRLGKERIRGPLGFDADQGDRCALLDRPDRIDQAAADAHIDGIRG